MKLETFDDVLASIKRNTKRPFHLLVGNGFSIAYDPKIFSYNALYNFIEDLDDADLTAVLSVIETRELRSPHAASRHLLSARRCVRRTA